MSTHTKAAIFAAGLLAGHVAFAQAPPQNPSLATLGAEAELVFEGAVIDVAFAPSIEGVPHTFVTYRVQDVLKGRYSAPTLTLRFIGGEIVDGDVLRKLSVSHSPTFETGQQDLLMVKGNTQSQCPLVRCARGRFKFEDGYVLSEEGAVIASGPQGGLLALPRAVESAGAGDSGAATRPELASADVEARPFDRASFIAYVREAVGRQDLRASAALGGVLSADAKQAFKGPDFAIAAPPSQRGAASPRQPVRSAPQSERDRQEIEALNRNGGNPVLPEKDVEHLRELPAPVSR